MKLVISTLLYGSETWTICSKQLMLLSSFHLRCLCKILNISCQCKVPINDVLSRRSCNSMYSIIVERTLRWAGHMQKLPAERLQIVVFYSELTEGTPSIGRPKKRCKEHLQDTLKNCGINPSEFESLAGDRPAWRQAVRAGANHYENKIRNKND